MTREKLISVVAPGGSPSHAEGAAGRGSVRPSRGGPWGGKLRLEPETPSEHRERMDWFKAVILPHEAALRRHLISIRAPWSDHDDLVSESLIRAFAAAGWRTVTHGRSYLFTIARNLILDGLRREKVVTLDLVSDLEALDVADGQPSAEDVVTARDELRRLRRAIDSLPTQRRRVFIRRRIEEVDIETIAREMRISLDPQSRNI